MTETINDLINKTESVSLAGAAEISHEDILTTIPEVWGATIEQDSAIKRIFRNFCIVNTDLLNGPGDTIKLPKHAVIDYDLYGPHDIANDLEELTASTEMSYPEVEIKPTEIGMAGSLTRQAIDESRLSLMEAFMSEYAGAYAQRDDIDIIRAATATTVDEEITFIEANQDSDVYVSGLWTVAKAGTLPAANTGRRNTGRGYKQLKWTATQSNLTAGDVLDLGVITEAQDVLMEEAGFTANVLVIHPKQFADLKRNPQFIDASKKGDNSVLKTGQVGNFFGLEVYKSKNLPALACGADGTVKGYQALLLDTTRALGYAIKRTMMVETEYKPNFRKYNVYMTWMSKCKRLNDGAIIAINTT